MTRDERRDERDARLPVSSRDWLGWPIFEDMDRWFESFRRDMEDFYGRMPFGPSRAFGSRAPPVDLMETDEGVVVTAELPGLEKDQVEIEIRDDALFISGDSRSEVEEEREGYWVRERGHATFRRAIRLPEGLDAEKASATLKNGVLEVTIPHAPEAKKKGRHVPVD